MKYKINLFGEGVHYWRCDVPEQVWKDILALQKRVNKDLVEIIFDLEFMEYLGFSSWKNFYTVSDVRLFKITDCNKIEIRSGRKKIASIKATDLLNSGLLFDLYNTSVIEYVISKKKGFVSLSLGQVEIGLIGSYHFESSLFDINKLDFQRVKSSGDNYLSGVIYEEVYLRYTEGDSVVSANFCELD